MIKKFTAENKIWKDLDKLSKLHFLWIIDLSNNLIECVKGLSGFVCLGGLYLSNNKLGWLSLESIKHLFVVDLKLHSNPCLEVDRHYRYHIVDMFPRVFCLDGRFINAIERMNTKIFFDKSNFDEMPVRRHTKINSFRPSSSKNLRYYCKISEEGFELLRQFPNVIPLIEEWDKKKIKYYAEFVVNQFNNSSESERWLLLFIESLLDKVYDVNLITELYIITTLFTANIEFGLPEKFIQVALVQNNLNFINMDQCKSFLLFSTEIKLMTITVFLAVISLANNQPKIEKEFMTELYHAINNIIWIEIRLKSVKNIEILFSSYKTEDIKTIYSLSKSLVAAEAFMLIHSFIENTEDIQTMELTYIINNATGQSDFSNALSVYNDMFTTEEIVNMIVTEIGANIGRTLSSSNLRNIERSNKSTKNVCSKFAQRLKHSNDNLCRGHSSISESVKISNHVTDNKKMEIGEKVLLGSQVLATILSTPELNTAMVQVLKRPSMGHKGNLRNDIKKGVMKIEQSSFIWNSANGYWIPQNSVGDKIFIYQNNSDKHSTYDLAGDKDKLTINVSKIEISDESILQKIDSDNEKDNNERKLSLDLTVHPSTRYSSPKSTPRMSKLVTPNLAMINFSPNKDCMTVTSITSDVFTPYTISSNSFQRLSIPSTKLPIQKDATMWLGNGDYIYKNVWWHSKNPSNMKKRYRLPKWHNDK